MQIADHSSSVIIIMRFCNVILVCGRFVTGCKACEDPTTICTECETGKAPTSDNTACGCKK